MKKILIVVDSIDVNDSSGSKANVALIKNLHLAGFHLRVLHYTRKNKKLPGIECIPIIENRRSLLFFLSRFERYARYYTKLELNKNIEEKFGFSFTLFNDRNSIQVFLKKHKNFEPDLVLTLSKGASFRPHHALLSIPEWHSKWMAYIHDPYPFASYPRPYDYIEPGHQQKRAFFLKVATKARYAAYPSKLLAQWMESYYPPLKGKAVIIPHQINSGEIKTTDLPPYFKRDCFTIVHAGALMTARNPMGLVEAFRQFLRDIPEAEKHSQILFLGKKSTYSKEFERIKKELPQLYSSDANIAFSSITAIQKNASVNVILEAKGPISPFLPGKFPHCIQAGRPILLLGPYYSESRRLLGGDYPYWAEIDETEKIAMHIKELYSRWKQDSNRLEFKRPDLGSYLSVEFLKNLLNEL